MKQVHRSFGDFWTVQMSVWSIVNSLLDNAMYPIIFVDYIAQFSAQEWLDDTSDDGTLADDSEPTINLKRWLTGMAMVLPIFLLNVKGVDLAGDFAVSFAVLVITPFAVMVVMGVPDLSWDAMMAPADPKTQDWGAYITVLLWNFCGFDSAGTVANEVAEPGKVYVPAMVLAMLLVTLNYGMPVLVGICAMTNSSRWVDGYWTVIGYTISGNWMAKW